MSIFGGSPFLQAIETTLNQALKGANDMTATFLALVVVLWCPVWFHVNLCHPQCLSSFQASYAEIIVS